MFNFVLRNLRWTSVIALGVLISVSAPKISSAQSTGVTEPTSTAPASSVVPIGPNDPLNVEVIGEPDLTNTYTVDANGDIQMPYVGKIHVEGLSPDQASTLIQEKLGQIYTTPQVTIVRPSIGGIMVTVTGAVNKQGDTTLRRDSHLNDVVQICGTTQDADIEHINITSGLPGQRHTTATYDLATFLNTGAPDDNPALMDGDQVFVPKKTETTESVSVIGEVVKPGRYNVAPGTTAFDLITQAGGLTPGADPTATYLQEMGSTNQTPFNYNTAAQNPSNAQLNPVLDDGEKIVVPLSTSVQTYALLGAVMKPGQYSIHGNVTLLNAIADAGGLQDHAKAKQTKVTRITPKGPTVIMVDSSDTKAAAEFNILPGDNIDIPYGSGGNKVDALTGIGIITGILNIFRF